MLTPEQIGERFPVRKSRSQKAAFRSAVKEFAQELGYTAQEEKGSFSSHNLVIGDPDKSEYLVTAHYDTCAQMIFPNLITPCNFFPYLLYQMFILVWMVSIPAVPALVLYAVLRDSAVAYYVWYGLFWVFLLLMLFGPANPSNVNDNTSGVLTVLEIMKSIPQNQRGKVCFVLFDLEEAGLIGSSSYYKAHKAAARNQLVLNLDCVGDGDHILLFPTKKLKKDVFRMEKLRGLTGIFGEKTIDIREKGFATYPSDQRNFPLGVGICALNKGPLGLYLGKIHTRRDKVLDKTNINILRAAIISLISRN